MGQKDKIENFKNFMVSTLQNSMITGIPQIAAAGTTPKKIVRALVFVLCVVGFIYQSLTFLDIYWSYPVIVDVQVTTPEVVDFPAITICNPNGIQRTKFCARQRCYNITDEDEFCCKNKRYCINKGKLPENFQIPVDYLRDEKDFSAHNEVKDYVQTFKEMMPICLIYFASREKSIADCNVSVNVKSTRSQGPTYLSSVCYTMNSLLDQPNEKSPIALSTAAYLMGLEPQGYEYDLFAKEVYLQVSVHSSYTVINPFMDGFALHPGRHYILRLKKTVKSLLPAPYSTNCTDYLKMWKDRGGHGPTTVKECVLECQLNASMELLGCADQNIKLPHNEKRCEDISPVNSVFLKADECGKKCGPACYEEIYEIVKDETSLGPEEDCHGLFIKSRAHPSVHIDENIILRINFNHMETTTYIYKPQYENIETFSYIGGYVGMWLGISLVAVFDFCETVWLLMKYPLGRLKSCCRRKFRSKMTHVRRLQHH